ncbi:MAG: spore germination protein [Oscillospiraceae bacterium]|jgi:spore germination protein KA|nr:spore germination protein [Oscillospiraceae bacterium]
MYQSCDENVRAIKARYPGDSDFIVREFEMYGGRKAAAVYIDGLTNADTISEFILKPLMLDLPINVGETGTAKTIDEASDAMLSGDTVVFIDGYDTAAYFNSKGFPTRSVTEPESETVVRGSREGFTESIRMNTAMLRRKLKTDHLRVEATTLGERSNTLVNICWIDNITNPGIVDMVRKRIQSVDVDGMLYTGQLEEYITDSPKSLFRTVGYTEKPDVAAAKLLEGRCAVMIDGTPYVLTMPFLFAENFQTAEDYVDRAYFATFLRILRTIAFFISVFMPSFYVALVMYHHELIPTQLMYNIAAAGEGTPFATPMEMVIMLLIFEILYEAGIRMPRPAGQAVSIVGALVMGQAAVEAGIVGAPIVIVVACSAISGFVMPSLHEVISLTRWSILIMTIALGGVGMVLGFVVLYVHLISLESYGAPYLAPLAPLSADMKDVTIRVPLRRMVTRPSALRPMDLKRQADSGSSGYDEWGE